MAKPATKSFSNTMPGAAAMAELLGTLSRVELQLQEQVHLCLYLQVEIGVQETIAGLAKPLNSLQGKLQSFHAARLSTSSLAG